MRKRLKVILLLMFLLAVISIAAFKSRPRQLMDYAHEVADTSNWGLHLTAAHSYQWLSDHTVLFSSIYDHYGSYDVQTKQTLWLDALSSRIEGATGDITERTASPDGRWLLWTVDNSYRHAATLDGTQFLTWDTGMQWNDELPCWMPDSRHWIEFTVDPITHLATEAKIYDVTAPTSVQTIPLAAPTNQHQQIVVAGVDKRLIVMAAREANLDVYTDPIPLVYPMNTKIEKPTDISLPSTGTQARQDLTVSPDGNLLAWTVQRDYPPTKLAIYLNRYFSRISTDTQRTEEIWLTPTDGSRSYKLGYILLNEAGVRKIGDLQWLPDSRHLSFIRDNTLYTIPAD